MDLLEHLGITPTDPTETDRPGDEAGLGVTPDERHLNVNGGVHGGLLATLLDAVMGRAVRAGLEEGQSAVTVSMTITYLRAGKTGQELRSSAEVRKRGSRLVLAEGDVSADGEPIAHGVATYSVVQSSDG